VTARPPDDERVFLEQALRHLEGTLSPEETTALWAAMVSDPARMRSFAALTVQRAHLTELGRGAPELRRPVAPRQRRAFALATTAVAALAVVVGAGLWRNGEEGNPAVATRPATHVAPAPEHSAAAPTPEDTHATSATMTRLAAVRGDVQVVSERKRLPALAGRTLASGEGLVLTGEHSHATLVVDEAGRLELGPGTEIGATSGPVLPMLRGRVFADVHGSFALNMPLGDIRADSAVRFRVDVQGEEAKIEVHRGTLRVTAFATGAVHELGAGVFASLAPERDAHIERRPPPPSVAFALQADPRELETLRRIPARTLAKMDIPVVGKEGLFAVNEDGFRCAGNQIYPLLGLHKGAALGNRKLMDAAWRVIDGTMTFQAEDGSFLDSVVCDADWLGELAAAMVVLVQSEWEPAYRDRIVALLPRMRRTAAYLTSAPRLEELRRADAAFSKGYFVHAVAFALTGSLLEDSALEALGREYLEGGLRQQRPDGAFLLFDGVDSAYQAVNLNYLAYMASRFEEPRYEAAIRLGGAWLMSRITAAGDLDVRGNTRTGPTCAPDKCFDIDWFRVAWGVLFYGADRDPRALAVTLDLLERKTAITR